MKGYFFVLELLLLLGSVSREVAAQEVQVSVTAHSFYPGTCSIASPAVASPSEFEVGDDDAPEPEDLPAATNEDGFFWSCRALTCSCSGNTVKGGAPISVTFIFSGLLADNPHVRNDDDLARRSCSSAGCNYNNDDRVKCITF